MANTDIVNVICTKENETGVVAILRDGRTVDANGIPSPPPTSEEVEAQRLKLLRGHIEVQYDRNRDHSSAHLYAGAV